MVLLKFDRALVTGDSVSVVLPGFERVSAGNIFHKARSSGVAFEVYVIWTTFGEEGLPGQ